MAALFSSLQAQDGILAMRFDRENASTRKAGHFPGIISPGFESFLSKKQAFMDALQSLCRQQGFESSACTMVDFVIPVTSLQMNVVG